MSESRDALQPASGVTINWVRGWKRHRRKADGEAGSGSGTPQQNVLARKRALGDVFEDACALKIRPAKRQTTRQSNHLVSPSKRSRASPGTNDDAIGLHSVAPMDTSPPRTNGMEVDRNKHQEQLRERFSVGEPKHVDLKVSISVRLYNEGYRRSRNPDGTATLYPYDRYSKDFLRCLDMGLLPAANDLPPQEECTYYNGCLVAEILDCRSEGTNDVENTAPSISARVLLRPDFFSLICDIGELANTSASDKELLHFERTALQRVHTDLDLDPTPDPTRLASRLISSADRLNISHVPRRRPPKEPYQSLSQRLPSLALALLGASHRQPRQNRVAKLARVANSSSTPHAYHFPITEERKGVPRPPDQVLKPPTDLPEISSGTLRGLRMAAPVKEETKPQGGTSKHQPICGLDITRTPGRGCNCIVRRCVFIDKSQPDAVGFARVHVGSEARATSFAEQFRRLARKEGFTPTQDSAGLFAAKAGGAARSAAAGPGDQVAAPRNGTPIANGTPANGAGWDAHRAVEAARDASRAGMLQPDSHVVQPQAGGAPVQRMDPEAAARAAQRAAAAGGVAPSWPMPVGGNAAAGTPAATPGNAAVQLAHNMVPGRANPTVPHMNGPTRLPQ